MLTNQTLITLSAKQALLDAYILKNHQLILDEEMFKKKIVAFIVELGEYANEERSFKYWSKKGSAALAIQLDEYIDGLHFLLSLGNDLQFNFAEWVYQPLAVTTNIDTYLILIQDLGQFAQTPNGLMYHQILNDYLMIAQISGYSESEILQAYQVKNQVNFDRQNQNY